MLTLRTIRAEKKKLIRRINALTVPHMWDSGFVTRPRSKSIFDHPGVPVRLYAPKAGLWEADYLCDDLGGCPDGVTKTGFVDAAGGGMAEIPFLDVPIEDLITFLDVIENFDFEKGRLQA